MVSQTWIVSVEVYPLLEDPVNISMIGDLEARIGATIRAVWRDERRLVVVRDA